MKRRKRRKRRAVLLTGPDRGRVAVVDRVDVNLEACRVTFGRGENRRRYRVMLDALDFDERSSEVGGFTADEASELNFEV